MNPNIIYIPDASVDTDLDRNLRDLFTTCFTQAQDEVFHHQRYFKRPYPHRWAIRDSESNLIAHTGVHEKELLLNGALLKVGGIAEVCVHPAYRGKGYVRSMLSIVHTWLISNGYSFSLLFGSPNIYQSSGYHTVGNLFEEPGAGIKEDTEPLSSALVQPLTQTLWPAQDVYMQGVPF